MNIARIEFTAEELPVEVLALASVRDDILLFVWNRDAIMPALQAAGIDSMLQTANMMVAEALNGETPLRLRAVS